LTIDHIDENIPNINWEAINAARAPVSGLFFFDTAYTLQEKVNGRKIYQIFLLTSAS